MIHRELQYVRMKMTSTINSYRQGLGPTSKQITLRQASDLDLEATSQAQIKNSHTIVGDCREMG